jgi:hypothetical protein
MLKPNVWVRSNFLLGFCAFAFLATAYNGPVVAQNAQCTILAPEDFGKVVPVTVNPAPPLNAHCSIPDPSGRGFQGGYISTTSSGIGINVNSRCTISVSQHTIQVPYEAHPPVIHSICRVGNVTGFISASYSSAPAPRPSPPVVQSIPTFYHWQSAANGSVPQNSVVGGYSSVQSHPGSTAISYGTPYYVCRAAFNGSIFSGKVVANNCNFSAATGKEILASSYQVLTANAGEYSLNWQRSGTPPANALIGGHWGQDLYLCQLRYGVGLHSGWAIPAQDGQYVCYIGLGGKEVVLPGFSYLVPIKGQQID